MAIDRDRVIEALQLDVCECQEHGTKHGHWRSGRPLWEVARALCWTSGWFDAMDEGGYDAAVGWAMGRLDHWCGDEWWLKFNHDQMLNRDGAATLLADVVETVKVPFGMELAEYALYSARIMIRFVDHVVLMDRTRAYQTDGHILVLNFCYYMHLIMRGDFHLSVRKLAEVTGLGHGTAYDHLKRLRRLGVLVEKEKGRPGRATTWTFNEASIEKAAKVAGAV